MNLTLQGWLYPLTETTLRVFLDEQRLGYSFETLNVDDFSATLLPDPPEEVAQAIAEHFAPTPLSFIEQREESKRQELFAEYDTKVLQYQREVRLGVAGGAERLAAWDAYAEALRAVNDTPDWYRDPQWPVKPEV